jgi:hypothetical protein
MVKNQALKQVVSDRKTKIRNKPGNTCPGARAKQSIVMMRADKRRRNDY